MYFNVFVSMYFNGLMFWYSAVFYWLYSHASVLIYSLFLYRLNIIVIYFLNLSFFRTIFHVFNSFVLFCIFLSFITHFSIPLYWYLSREAFWQETVLSPLTHDLCQPPPGTQLPSDTSSSYHFGLLLLKYEIDIGNQLNYIGTQLPSDTSSSYRTSLYFHFFAPQQIFLRYWTSIALIQFLFGLLPRNKSSVSFRLRQMCRPVYLLLLKIPSCASSRDLKKFVLLRGNSWSSRHFN